MWPWVRHCFLDMTPKAQMRKEKQIRWTSSKLSTFVLQRTSSKRVKGQPTKWGKIFVNHVSEKGLTSRIYIKKKNPYNSITKKDKPILKMTKILNRHFSRDDINVAKKHMKRYLTSSVIRKCK